MQTKQPNIYKTARAGTGLTQEQAAELLDLSVESVKAYETGQRVPPDCTVRLMAERYGTPGLRLEHARATDELGIIPEAAAPRSFVLVAIQIYNFMLDWAEKHRGQQLLRIAEDGVISDDEWPLLDEIICEMEGLSAAWLSLKCCEGAKKERPEAGTSKRSVPRNLRTTAKPLYQVSRGNASTICAGEAVNSL